VSARLIEVWVIRWGAPALVYRGYDQQMADALARDNSHLAPEMRYF
jgi:hypothetical protein